MHTALSVRVFDCEISNTHCHFTGGRNISQNHFIVINFYANNFGLLSS